MSIWLVPPVVKNIDASGYTGQPGSQLTVHAKDDFRIAAVQVSIHSAAGKLIVEGLAAFDSINRNKWIIPEKTGSLELVLP